MEIIIVIAVLFVAFIIFSSGKKSTPKNVSESYPYRRKFILTKNEYSFYKILKKITDEKNMLICPKVGLKDIFEVTEKNNHLKYFGKISQKHVDFIICDNDLKILFAIELDDNSHNSTERKKSDIFKDKIFETGKIELLRIKAFTSYTEKYVRENVFKESDSESLIADINIEE